MTLRERACVCGAGGLAREVEKAHAFKPPRCDAITRLRPLSHTPVAATSPAVYESAGAAAPSTGSARADSHSRACRDGSCSG